MLLDGALNFFPEFLLPFLNLHPFQTNNHQTQCYFGTLVQKYQRRVKIYVLQLLKQMPLKYCVVLISNRNFYLLTQSFKRLNKRRPSNMKSDSLQEMKLSLTVFFFSIVHIFPWTLQLLLLFPTLRAFFNFIFSILVQFKGNINCADDGLSWFLAIQRIHQVVPSEKGNSSIDKFFGSMRIFTAKFPFPKEVDDDVGVVLDEKSIIDVLLVGFIVEFGFVAYERVVLCFSHEPKSVLVHYKDKMKYPQKIQYSSFMIYINRYIMNDSFFSLGPWQDKNNEMASHLQTPKYFTKVRKFRHDFAKIRLKSMEDKLNKETIKINHSRKRNTCSNVAPSGINNLDLKFDKQKQQVVRQRSGSRSKQNIKGVVNKFYGRKYVQKMHVFKNSTPLVKQLARYPINSKKDENKNIKKKEEGWKKGSKQKFNWKNLYAKEYRNRLEKENEIPLC